MKNFIIRSINDLKRKYPFKEEGICKVDGNPCRCIYFGRWDESLRDLSYITIIWWKGAWQSPLTSFGMGYHGKMISIQSKI